MRTPTSFLTPRVDLWLCNGTGLRLAYLTDWSGLTCTVLHPISSVGSLVIRVPRRYEDLIAVGGMVEVWVTPLPWRVPVHLGTFIIEKIAKALYDIQISATHTTQLLKFRIVIDAQDTAGAKKTGAADDIIKAFAREQIATLTSAASRNLNNFIPFSVEPDHSQGVSITTEASHATVLQACQDVVKAAQESLSTPMWISFGVENLGHDVDFSLVLRTWVGFRGRDHSLNGPDPLVLSRLTCLDDIVREIDHSSEVNVAVIGGSGSGTSRVTQTVENTSSTAIAPYWRREAWVDGGNTNDGETLTQKGTRKLREAKALDRFRAVLVPHPAAVWGVHFDLGDLVVADVDEKLWDCRVEGVTLGGNSGSAPLINIRLEIV